MIYRKWSLLTGPVAILGSIVGTVIVGHYLFIENEWLHKPEARKEESGTSSK